MKEFRGKVAAITGAGSGIGRALSMELARRGCALSISDIDGAKLAETAAAARGLGAKVTERMVDVADRAAVHAWADATVAEHGKVNLVFNNAGVALVSTVQDVSYEALEWILAGRFARKYGGSKRAGWGAIIGGIVGAFVGVPIPIVGSVIGAFAGAFVGVAVGSRLWETYLGAFR